MEVKINETKVNYLEKPLSKNEMKKQMKDNNIVTGIVAICLSDIINNDFEEFLDLLSEQLTGTPCLMGIDYEVIAADEDFIYIKVTGDASNIIE